MRMMPVDCAHVAELLPWFLNGSLDAGERRAVEEHLESCEVCRRELADTRFAGAVFGQHLSAETLVDYGFGRAPPDVGVDVVEEHLATCPKCSAELELVRESAWRAGRDEARILPFASPRRQTVPRSSWAALAAGIVGVVAAGWMGWELRTASQRLEDPVLNVRVADAYPVDAVSRDRERPVALEIPAGTEKLVLLLQAPSAEEYPAYDLELVDASGEVLFLGEGLLRQPEGDFTVSLRTDDLPRELTLRILGRRGDERREIARYLLAPRPAGSGD